MPTGPHGISVTDNTNFRGQSLATRSRLLSFRDMPFRYLFELGGRGDSVILLYAPPLRQHC